MTGSMYYLLRSKTILCWCTRADERERERKRTTNAHAKRTEVNFLLLLLYLSFKKQKKQRKLLFLHNTNTVSLNNLDFEQHSIEAERIVHVNAVKRGRVLASYNVQRETRKTYRDVKGNAISYIDHTKWQKSSFFLQNLKILMRN